MMSTGASHLTEYTALRVEIFCSELGTVKLTVYLIMTEKPVIRKCIFQKGENALSRLEHCNQTIAGTFFPAVYTVLNEKMY